MKNIFYSLIFLTISIPAFAQKADTIIGSGMQKKVQIYYFHITKRCNTCRNIEAKTISVLDSLFKTEINNGTLVFVSYNCELKENMDISQKYEAYGATLAITTYKNGFEANTVDLTNWAFEKINKSAEFKNEFAEKIREKLKQ